MKTGLKIFLSIIISSFIFLKLSAQEEIVFNPSELLPHEDGYYLAGVDLDENDDGLPEHYDGCDDYYEDNLDDGIYDPHVNHEETGEQQGFKYFNCLIMPDCEHKSTPIEPPVALGYIQMSACQYSNTDTAILSYIQSPPITNLVSLYMETSSDVSINENRRIPYNIEFSKNNGATWEADYIMDNVFAQGGYRITYDDQNANFDKMIQASNLGPIVLRIITNDRSVIGSQQGQFVKLHALTITAEKSTAVQNTFGNDFKIKVYGREIISEDAKIDVYSILGRYMGTGKSVNVEKEGIYIVKSESGTVKKILVK